MQSPTKRSISKGKAISPKSPKETHQKNTKPKDSQYVRYHQLIISLPGTAEDHLLYSLLSSYTLLDQNQRKLATDEEKLSELLRTTQQELFIKLLESELISPVSANSVVDQKIVENCREFLYEKDLNEIKFSILGPSHCGKTRILYHFASTFYRKLQFSSDSDSVFVFPFNMQKNFKQIADPFELYQSITRILLDSLLFSRFQIWNSFLQISEWFYSIPTIGTLCSLPKQMQENPFINTKKLLALSKKIHSSFRSTTTSLEAMHKLLLSIPYEFASVFGFKYVFFIIDEVKYVSEAFSNALIEGMNNMPFIITAIEDKNFIAKFKKSSIQIYPENFCDVEEERKLRLESLIVSVDDCMGFPSYVHTFYEILNDVENTQITKKKYGSYSPITSIHKNTLTRRKLLSLIESLVKVGNKKFNNEIINSLSESTSQIEII